MGATPVLVDVEEGSFNLDPKSLARAIPVATKLGLTPKAVIPVDLFGQPADHAAIAAIAEAEKLFVIDDAAQAFGATYRNRKIGTLGHATGTSFFPAKPLGCYGDGGAMFTDDDELAEILRSLRVHGEGRGKYDCVRTSSRSGRPNGPPRVQRESGPPARKTGWVGPTRRLRAHPMRRRVTFSRNITLSLSRTCQCFCKYCAFETHRAHLHAPDEVIALLDGAARRNVKELLVLTGERPEVNPEVRERLGELGPRGLHRLRRRGPASGRSSAGCCRTRTSACCSREDLARLREVTASQGLMLESRRRPAPPTRARRRRTPRAAWRRSAAAGELRIPFTSGILVGIGERAEDRVAALRALAAVHAEHGHLQEVILQNFVPHRRYYGEEPAEIATEAAERVLAHGPAGAGRRAGPGLGHAGHARRDARAGGAARELHAGRRRAGAAQPGRLVARARRRRRDRPRRPQRQRRPHLARAPVPLAAPGAPAARAATASR